MHTTTGTSQHRRTLPELLPGYVRIDDRDTAQLLAFASAYARLVRFYDEHDEMQGHWGPFFATDISAILADVVSTDLTALENRQQALATSIGQRFQELEKYGLLLEFFQSILGLFRQTDTWYQQALRIDVTFTGLEHTVSQELRNVIVNRLRPLLYRLIAFDRGAAAPDALGDVINLSYEGLHPVWEIASLDILPVNIYKGKDWNEKLDQALVQLRLLYRGVFNVHSYLVIHFRRFFEQSLTAKSDHKPDMGLFITFLHLFRHAQHELNSLASRHLDFYYRHFLLQQHQGPVPDEVHVCFRAAPHVERHLLPAGTRLLAGRNPDSSELAYETLDDLEVTHARVASLRTFYLGKNRRIEIGNYRTVTGIYDAPIANSRDGLGTPFEGSRREWPTFGEEQLDKTEQARRMRESEIGFAIASPMLYLREGHREVSITLEFVNESVLVYRELIQDLARMRYTGNTFMAFEEVFPLRKEKRNLAMYYTGPEGWVEVPPQNLRIAPEKLCDDRTPEWKPYQLVLQFDLPPGSPACVGYNSQLHGGQPLATQQPVVRLVLDHAVQPYLYSFLRDLELKAVEIEVAVSPLRQIEVYNESGRLDPQQPFQPFGPLPSLGSYLMVGNAEIFRKPLTELNLHFEWQQIPPSTRRFDEHYAPYGKESGIVWNAFEVALTALSGRSFQPVEEDKRPRLPLFQPVQMEPDEQGGLPMRLTSMQHLPIDQLGITPDATLDRLGTYTPETASGFLRLELTAPEHAFGHHIYQDLFAEAVTFNALPKNQEAQKAVPKQPYTPLLKNLTLSYRAKTRIDATQVAEGDNQAEQIYHLHPFGVMTTFARGRRRIAPMHLLPQYDHDGYLYIGIEGARPPETLSLLFQLTVSHSREHSRFQLPEITWAYLSRNEWKDFAPEDRLLDSTDGFTRTGLVRLRLPRELSDRNNLLPAGMCWLRVAVKGDTEVLCHAIDVRSQALRCRWVPDSYPERLRRPLAPGSITALQSMRTEILGVEQPFASFGGKAPESDEAFFGRVSERLRHKNRGITHWDIERLALDRFHTLAQVKCISHLSDPEYLGPQDDVVLVVIPGINDSPDERRPRVNYRTLQEVHAWLGRHMSPFAHQRLRVRNPQYEFVRIYANIRFAEGANNGQALQRLARDVEGYICPWTRTEGSDVQLGTPVSQDALIHFIQGLDYVVGLWDFSLMHIWFDEGQDQYVIRDTARETGTVSVITPRPWGVVIPDDEHMLRIVGPRYDENEDPVRLRELKSTIPFQGFKDITQDAADYQIRIRRREAGSGPEVAGKASYSLHIKL
ncbi:MAG: hypothetical protein OHK0039_16260 [Bacteroidia bacterium]